MSCCGCGWATAYSDGDGVTVILLPNDPVYDPANGLYLTENPYTGIYYDDAGSAYLYDPNSGLFNFISRPPIVVPPS